MLWELARKRDYKSLGKRGHGRGSFIEGLRESGSVVFMGEWGLWNGEKGPGKLAFFGGNRGHEAWFFARGWVLLKGKVGKCGCRS
jgi:hypothetical protein